jgi:hypothetical protein
MRMLHTMLRIGDLENSLAFIQKDCDKIKELGGNTVIAFV